MKQQKYTNPNSGKISTGKIFWLLLLSILFLLPNFISFHFFKLSNRPYNWEAYESSLAGRLQSVDAILRFTDSLTVAQNIKPGTLEYGVMLNRVVKWRFYHGYSHYSLSQNWIAAFCGKYIWNDLSAIVVPDDILKYPMAACSQQSIVLMECLRRKKILYRNITFDHHYAVEAKFNDWYYFDPDMEPDFSNIKRGSSDFLVRNKLFGSLYRKSMDSLQVSTTLAHPKHGKVNARPAPSAMIFQRTTKLASKTIWLLPFSFCLFFLIRAKNQNSERAALLFVRKILQKKATLQKAS